MFYQLTDEGAIISVRVQPRSSRAGVEGVVENALRVRLRSAPVDGKANRELIETLADFYELPKSQVVFKSGETAKLKRIILKGITEAQIRSKHEST